MASYGRKYCTKQYSPNHFLSGQTLNPLILNSRPTPILKPELLYLPFDSSLFGYQVGKTTIGDSWNEKDFLKAAGDFRLVYLFSEKPVELHDHGFHWVDTKVIFEKELQNQIEVVSIQPFQGNLNNELEELAFLSGIHSRFKIDPRLQNGEFEKLYRLWITKAYESNSILQSPDLAGMVTLTVEHGQANIGLIAVSGENQGKGWGRKLLQAAEYQAFRQGAVIMKIPTQSSNAPACKLYESLGYQLKNKIHVYHYWNNS
ncbi:GNAT family N-acetyltransferase [Algoriphagus resistens]|uniref:GNAT family N-acetyltransferase n=1 Tax=Algoriphagus resistens TaxID=1750590 RepID=UPI000716B0F8|nr:GNAT family N-acetyltransferase [Algoriphagus resistens]